MIGIHIISAIACIKCKMSKTKISNNIAIKRDTNKHFKIDVIGDKNLRQYKIESNN